MHSLKIKEFKIKEKNELKNIKKVFNHLLNLKPRENHFKNRD